MWHLGGMGSPPFCSPGRRCAAWAWTYLHDCVCGTKDVMALGLGLVSVVSWGVAEVPQIVTNYKSKSTEGLSLAFLMTWIVGDLFNLIGCYLEPATLPTQFYMALLYTITTVVLTTQTIYYGKIYKWLQAKKSDLLHTSSDFQDGVLAGEKLLYRIDEKEPDESNVQKESPHVPSSPIPVSASAHGSAGRDLYYRSARSLSKSPLSTAGSWLRQSRDLGRVPSILSPDRCLSREPLLGNLGPTQSAPTTTTKNMLCVASSAVFLVCSYHFHFSKNETLIKSPGGVVIRVGRKLRQVVESSQEHGGGGSGIGSILGWAMAAIYMGGRLPQICLNIRRGNVEGLSPLMFIFALLGNATYVGSILVKSVEWSRIRPNMPWLVDAGGCVLLDAFILIQFVYFRLREIEDVDQMV